MTENTGWNPTINSRDAPQTHDRSQHVQFALTTGESRSVTQARGAAGRAAASLVFINIYLFQGGRPGWACSDCVWGWLDCVWRRRGQNRNRGDGKDESVKLRKPLCTQKLKIPLHHHFDFLTAWFTDSKSSILPIETRLAEIWLRHPTIIIKLAHSSRFIAGFIGLQESDSQVFPLRALHLPGKGICCISNDLAS